MKASYPRRILGAIIDGIVSYLIHQIVVRFSSFYMYWYWFLWPIFLFYYVYLGMKYHKTLGMWMVGIEITTADGRNFSFKRSMLRFLGSLLSCFFFLGCIWMFWDKRRQTWHDKLAGTYVIMSVGSEISSQTPVITPYLLIKRGKIQKIIGIWGIIPSLYMVLIPIISLCYNILYLHRYKGFQGPLMMLFFCLYPFLFFLFLYLVGKDMERNEKPLTLGEK